MRMLRTYAPSPWLSWCRPGSSGLSWFLWPLLGSSVLFWARLSSPGLVWASPGLSKALESPGLVWALLGSSGLSWARLGSPGLHVLLSIKGICILVEVSMQVYLVAFVCSLPTISMPARLMACSVRY